MTGTRAAFFYPWYPRSWEAGTHYAPLVGAPYSSADPAVLAYQVAAMTRAKIDVAISSWWGQGDATDLIVPRLLAASAGTALTWCLYYEPASGNQAADLAYIYKNYATLPGYAWSGGKPLLFVYGRSVGGPANTEAWVQANQASATPFTLSLQVYQGYRQSVFQPDLWHQYGPASRTDRQKGFSFTVSPGYWKYADPAPLLARSPQAFAVAVAQMTASGEPWQLVTSWNEWGEGHSVECADAWRSASGFGAYCDILASDGLP